ncbi:MAG: hypothetical protein HWN67_04655 [Candidatus Helarchaeota archaeon]|nr:hypothetical protein [Candidatus Helarchaeota archaeon]
MPKIDKIDLDDLKPRYLEQEKKWNDWFGYIPFSYENKQYLLTFMIAHGSYMGGTLTRLGLSSDPFKIKREKGVKVIPRPEFHKIYYDRLKLDDLKVIEDQDYIKIELGNLITEGKPNHVKFTSNDKNINGEITFTPRGPILYYGDAKNAECKITETSNIGGIILIANVRGRLNFFGNEVEINERGFFLREWIKSLRYSRIRFMDWIVLHFDEMISFHCHIESDTDKYCPYHWECGSLYMFEGDEILISRKLEIKPTKWVFLKSALCYIPSKQEIIVETDKGTLRMKTTNLLQPQFGANEIFEDMKFRNILGWRILHYDLYVSIDGEFEYKNGKIMKLTNGAGVVEHMRVSPLY